MYVDGFVIPIKKKNLKIYKKIADTAGKVWMEYGALHYFECMADDVNMKFGLPFPKLCKLKKDETALFSFIVYKSKSHRNQVNKKVMKDPRITANMTCPFEMKRFSYGGFKSIIAKSK